MIINPAKAIVDPVGLDPDLGRTPEMLLQPESPSRIDLDPWKSLRRHHRLSNKIIGTESPSRANLNVTVVIEDPKEICEFVLSHKLYLYYYYDIPKKLHYYFFTVCHFTYCSEKPVFYCHLLIFAKLMSEMK